MAGRILGVTLGREHLQSSASAVQDAAMGARIEAPCCGRLLALAEGTGGCICRIGGQLADVTGAIISANVPRGAVVIRQRASGGCGRDGVGGGCIVCPPGIAPAMQTRAVSKAAGGVPRTCGREELRRAQAIRFLRHGAGSRCHHDQGARVAGRRGSCRHAWSPLVAPSGERSSTGQPASTG